MGEPLARWLRFNGFWQPRCLKYPRSVDLPVKVWPALSRSCRLIRCSFSRKLLCMLPTWPRMVALAVPRYSVTSRRGSPVMGSTAELRCAHRSDGSGMPGWLHLHDDETEWHTYTNLIVRGWWHAQVLSQSVGRLPCCDSSRDGGGSRCTPSTGNLSF